MKKIVLGLLSAAALLAACPASGPPGDVQYGDYDVTADPRDGGDCRLDPSQEQEQPFTFAAHLAADYDGGAYLTVQQPPGAVSQQPRRGSVSDGGFVFVQEQSQDLSYCGCMVDVQETVTLYPQTGTPDGGTADGGEPDGGVADGGAGATDGGNADASVPGLPPVGAITGVHGGLDYVMSSAGNCPAPRTLDDGGLVGCPLPCTFGYDLSGARQ